MDPKALPLTDEKLSAINPALLTLVQRLEDVAQRDPNANVSAIASALAEYFRTPD
ncbi:MAG: hypothetical protein V4645_27800 [Pseudomonadota bacterium]